MRLRVVTPASPISALALREAVQVAGDTPIAEVAHAMHDAGVSAVLVDGDAAIATERDLVRAVEAELAPDAEICAVATPYPVRVGGDCSVMDAAARMLNEEVRHLVVDLDDGDVAIVSLREVMAVLLGAVNPEIWLTRLRVAITRPSEVWVT